MVVDVDKEVKMEASEIIGKVFQGDYYYNIPTDQYMKEMGMENRIVEPADIGIKPQDGKNTIGEVDAKKISIDKKETKPIDWEERHFQICLALMQGEATKKAGSSFPYAYIIRVADRMVEALKKHYQEKNL